MTNKTEKTVKAWVILGGRNRPVAVEIGAKRPERYNIGTWTFFTHKNDSSVVPCTITYTLPTDRSDKQQTV